MNSYKRNKLIEILKLYKSLPVLWNTSDANYTNKDMKEICYEKLLQLYKQFDAKANMNSVRTKIRNMKANYRKELDKVIKSRIAGEKEQSAYVPTLWYYQLFDEIIGGQELTNRGLLMHLAINCKEQQQQMNNSAVQDDAAMLAEQWAVNYRQLCKQQQQLAKANIEQVLTLAQQKQLTAKRALVTILEQLADDNSQLDTQQQQMAAKKSKDFYCNKCNKTFASSASLRKHNHSHQGIKPYACDICDARFVESSNLKTHRDRHLGEKPYLCTVCGKNFTTSNELTLHNRSHTKEKPYQCSQCTCAYSNASNLKEHVRTHSNLCEFACDKCNKRFKRRAALRKHKLIHSTERPFICAACGATFRLRNALQQHLQLHSGLKPFTCDKCFASFAQRAGLAGHKKRCFAQLVSILY